MEEVYETGEPQKPISWTMVDDLRRDWLAVNKLHEQNYDAHKFMQSLIVDTDEDFKSSSDWLNRWTVILDHVIYFNYLIYSCYANELGKTNSDAVRCFASLQSSIFDDLYSIRILISHGRELAARKLLRSFSEHLELQLLIYFDSSLIPEFFNTHDEVTANKFWRKVLARGKVGKKLYQVFEKQENGEVYSLLLEYGRNQLSMLGQLIHPSYISIVLSFLRPISGVDKDDYIPFRYPIDASVRTIKHIVALAILSLFVMKEFPLDGDTNSFHLQFDPTNRLHLVTRTGRVVMMAHLGKLLFATDEFFSVS